MSNSEWNALLNEKIANIIDGCKKNQKLRLKESLVIKFVFCAANNDIILIANNNFDDDTNEKSENYIDKVIIDSIFTNTTFRNYLKAYIYYFSDMKTSRTEPLLSIDETIECTGILDIELPDEEISSPEQLRFYVTYPCSSELWKEMLDSSLSNVLDNITKFNDPVNTLTVQNSTLSNYQLDFNFPDFEMKCINMPKEKHNSSTIKVIHVLGCFIKAHQENENVKNLINYFKNNHNFSNYDKISTLFYERYKDIQIILGLSDHEWVNFLHATLDKLSNDQQNFLNRFLMSMGLGLFFSSAAKADSADEIQTSKSTNLSPEISCLSSASYIHEENLLETLPETESLQITLPQQRQDINNNEVDFSPPVSPFFPVSPLSRLSPYSFWIPDGDKKRKREDQADMPESKKFKPL